VQRLLWEDPRTYSTDATQVAAALGEMAGPLDEVVGLLNSKLLQSLRQYRLDDPNAAQPPPAYRDAVADYFERLSRDYRSGESSPQPERTRP
jgi:hypothetical protein